MVTIYTLSIFAVFSLNACVMGQQRIVSTHSNYLKKKNIKYKYCIIQPITDHIYGGLSSSTATLGTRGNVFHDEAAGRRLDAHAQVSKPFQPRGPTQYGAGLEYTAPKLGASVDVQHARNWGTHVNAEGRANVFESRDHRTRVDATANYGQNFGPKTRPDVGAGLRLTHRF